LGIYFKCALGITFFLEHLKQSNRYRSRVLASKPSHYGKSLLAGFVLVQGSTHGIVGNFSEEMKPGSKQREILITLKATIG